MSMANSSSRPTSGVSWRCPTRRPAAASAHEFEQGSGLRNAFEGMRASLLDDEQACYQSGL